MRGARPSHLSQLNFEPLQAHSSLGLFHPSAAISKSEKTQTFDNFNARDLGLSLFSLGRFIAAERLFKRRGWQKKKNKRTVRNEKEAPGTCPEQV